MYVYVHVRVLHMCVCMCMRVCVCVCVPLYEQYFLTYDRLYSLMQSSKVVDAKGNPVCNTAQLLH